MTALLLIRAAVPAAERDAFDRWYEDEHLPDAHAAFAARASWRGWAEGGEGPIHLAGYEFASLAEAEAIPASEAMAEMRRRFDHAFPHIARSREVVALAQRLD
ncbi:MAG: hypothetical protein R6V44_12680 [Paracoccaceae bacterium]